ncbi:MAG: putative lipid II flippase FtsW [Clostridiales bacterium]|nr:putative lipid II flippase FtsW [Clostridiales bacterium]
MAEQERNLNKRPTMPLFAKGGFDPLFAGITIVLLAIGLIMLFSASYSYAYYNEGDSLYYIRRQFIFAVTGLAIMFFISRINYQWFKVAAYPLIGLSFLLLVVVLMLPALPDTPDFKRWIYVPGTSLPTFQPSDLAKVAVVLFCAYRMEREQKKLRTQPFAFVPYAILMMVFGGLIYLENHVSGFILIVAICVVMMYLGGVKRYWFILGIGVVALAVIIVIIKPDILPTHASQRIVAWLDKNYDPLNTRWQTNQSLYAISSGGFLGTGIGASKQKHLYVSEPQNDFIFAIVCEELGFVGAVIILLLFAALIWRGVSIALKAKDRFGCLLVLGLIFQIGIQVVLNVGVVTDTLPNTGIALPFFSYGGTALWVLLGELGMILSVSRNANIKKV